MSQPVIPDPRQPISEASAYQRQTSLLPVITGGLLVTAALYALSLKIPIAWMIIASTAVYLAVALLIMAGAHRTAHRLHDEIAGPEDLEQALHLVDLNMKIAFIMMVTLYPLLLVSILRGAGLWALVMAGVFGVLSPLTTRLETRIRAFAVTSDEPHIQSRWNLALKRWGKEPSFGLLKLEHANEQ